MLININNDETEHFFQLLFCGVPGNIMQKFRQILEVFYCNHKNYLFIASHNSTFEISVSNFSQIYV